MAESITEVELQTAPTDLPPDDEPQFSVADSGAEKKKRGKSKYGNAIVPLFLLLSAVVVVAKFDQIKAGFSGDKQVKTVESAQSDIQPVMPDYQVTEPVSDPVVKPAVAIDKDHTPPAQVADSVNVVLANKIGDLTAGLSALTDQLASVNAELQAIKQAQQKGDQVVLSGLQRIADGLEQIKVRDGQSEKVLSSVITDLRGFKESLKEERLKFSLRILHVESYGGQLRVVGFEESSPQKVLKLYTGDDVGLWRLKLLSESKAVFVHADGLEHTEVIR